MRFVVRGGAGVVELNYMWLPTWLGQNHAFKKELEKEIGPTLVGRELTEDVLDETNALVIRYVLERYKIPGLRHYLDGIKFIEM